MPQQRVGTCSICGGDVIGFRGPWHGINPPPSDRCSGCNATNKDDVIEMVPSPPTLPPSWSRKVWHGWSGFGRNGGP